MGFDIATGLRNSRGPGGTKFVVGTIANVGTGPVPPGSDTDVLSELTVQVDSGNTSGVFLGDTASQTIKLAPGGSITLPCGEVTSLEVKAQGADTNITVNYIGVVA